MNNKGIVSIIVLIFIVIISAIIIVGYNSIEINRVILEKHIKKTETEIYLDSQLSKVMQDEILWRKEILPTIVTSWGSETYKFNRGSKDKTITIKFADYFENKEIEITLTYHNVGVISAEGLLIDERIINTDGYIDISEVYGKIDKSLTFYEGEAEIVHNKKILFQYEGGYIDLDRVIRGEKIIISRNSDKDFGIIGSNDKLYGLVVCEGDLYIYGQIVLDGILVCKNNIFIEEGSSLTVNGLFIGNDKPSQLNVETYKNEGIIRQTIPYLCDFIKPNYTNRHLVK